MHRRRRGTPEALKGIDRAVGGAKPEQCEEQSQSSGRSRARAVGGAKQPTLFNFRGFCTRRSSNSLLDGVGVLRQALLAMQLQLESVELQELVVDLPLYHLPLGRRPGQLGAQVHQLSLGGGGAQCQFLKTSNVQVCGHVYNECLLIVPKIKCMN
ncbi:hypothetical protein EYF80_043466 [Liparis tanakae]|uniref:Uncharacterized protein n=1 Tax=Liparis tanakae TaxID=230148 RepID=A0A4Z2FYP1_9TELE|nr:hypothetical protein EYF80_043466 [Liparis tanakae]